MPQQVAYRNVAIESGLVGAHAFQYAVGEFRRGRALQGLVIGSLGCDLHRGQAQQADRKDQYGNENQTQRPDLGD